jgi:hypothetical protein
MHTEWRRDRGSAVFVQPTVEQPGGQQIRCDEDAPPPGGAKHLDNVTHPRRAGRDATEMDLTDTLGQHLCGTEQFASCTEV